MADAPDIAMQNFTHNTLRGMGTGGSIASSNGAQGLFAELDLHSSHHARIGFPCAFSMTIGKLFEGMQGAASSLTPANIFSGLAPPITPLGESQHVPSLFSKR